MAELLCIAGCESGLSDSTTAGPVCRNCNAPMKPADEVRAQRAARTSFDEDHSPTKRHSGRGHRSIPHSYGGESRNFID